MARIKPQQLLLQSKKKKGPTKISAATIVACNLVLVLVVLSLYATYRHWHYRSTNQDVVDLSNFEAADSGDSKYANIPGYAIFNTAKGPITVELYKDSSRNVVVKFGDLCKKGYFKGMPFQHVIKSFVIQGGHSETPGAAADWILKGKDNSQLPLSPKHEAFMLGTTRNKMEDKEFELFITTAPIADLNDKLIVFGRVIKGQDIVQEIEEVDTDEHYRPKSAIGIIDITLKQEV